MKQTSLTLIDDLDGSLADETITFGVDRLSYTIDLNNAHAHQLRAALTRFIAVARRSNPPATPAVQARMSITRQTQTVQALKDNPHHYFESVRAAAALQDTH